MCHPTFLQLSDPAPRLVALQSCDLTMNGTQLLNNTAARGGAVSCSLALADSNKPGLVTVELDNVTARCAAVATTVTKRWGVSVQNKG
jgi:hypothetical protein